MRNKKIEKTHAKENNHTHKTIFYMVRQFAYVHGVARNSLLSGKKYKSAVTVFSLSQKHGNQHKP